MKKQIMKYQILVIGAGGTGTYFLKEFSRYLSGNKKALKKVYSLAVADGDLVEKKNLARQAFAIEDIGHKKAAVMASLLNDNFDLSWNAYGKYLLKTEQIEQAMNKARILSYTDCNKIPVLIGCVDNHACRLLCEDYFYSKDNCIYFDSANEFSSGEIVYASRIKGKTISSTRSQIFPDIKEGKLRNVEEMSCAELNAAAPQHIVVNMNAGLCLLSAVARLLEEDVLMGGVTFFDAMNMNSRHMENAFSMEKAVS